MTCDSRLFNNDNFKATVAVSVAILLLILGIYVPLRRRMAQARQQWQKVSERYSLQVKLRLVIGFYQIITQVSPPFGLWASVGFRNLRLVLRFLPSWRTCII